MVGRRRVRFGALLGLCLLPAQARASEADTAARFDAIRDRPAALRLFLKAMPKGGDLHNHLSGSVYAEDYVSWAEQRGYCVEAATLTLAAPPCGLKVAAFLARDPANYGRLIDALSMRGWLAGTGRQAISGHDQMFGSFARFGAIADAEPGRSLAAVRATAADDHVSYVELMYNPLSIDTFAVETRDPAWRGEDFAGALERFRPQMAALLARARAETDRTAAEGDRVQQCGTRAAEPGCAVTVRYMAYALRLLPPAQIFRELALCFAMAAADPRYVGVNILEPEDDPRALADYALHMRMIAFLAARYPGVHRSLHAGELAVGLVPPAALRDHIEQAVDTGGAERIGHGTDIALEADAPATLARMARDHVDVEINLTSNNEILGVRGGDHPIGVYRAAGVPITLSTDDEGVLRTDMTEQYVRAATEHGLRYADLKTAARNSLEYSFLPGDSLWADHEVGTSVAACADRASATCSALAAHSPKATAQLRLEAEFDAFEK